MTTALTPPERAAPRRRRKADRPGEIIAAAIEVFVEQGFGAAKLEEVARRAGVAKGTVFVYFPTKEALFRAVARSVLDGDLGGVAAVADLDRPAAELVAAVLAQAAVLGQSPVAGVVRLIIAEAKSFPDLAQVWHDEVVARALAIITLVIERAQARGEIRAGDPRLYAFSILGPMLAAVLFRQVFADAGAALPDLPALARQHAATIIDGLRPAGEDRPAI
ncbi:MAG TPA: TetR/AcrR family transcriptional regulator [Caulobacteraceae bacterium]|jgi:AcrR family transcriptional regulator|nr:TetR/AcrR family transcriptional regulator [Caulobacteraceae bacterium]